MKTISIVINRFYYTDNATIGELFLDGQRIGYTLEDRRRNHHVSEGDALAVFKV